MKTYIAHTAKRSWLLTLYVSGGLDGRRRRPIVRLLTITLIFPNRALSDVTMVAITLLS